jgi:outer membrane biosynthesis protein TonB
MSNIDFKQLKEMVKALNEAVYLAEDNSEVEFLEDKIKIAGVSAEKLKDSFIQAIATMDEDVQQVLPDEISDYYNDLISEDPEPEPEPEPEKPSKKTSAKEEKKKEKEKAKKEPGKKKEPAELSVFGHKMNTQAAKLDALLAPGKSISLEELIKGSGRSALGVKSHVKHLIEARGLTINVKDNMYRFVKNPTK